MHIKTKEITQIKKILKKIKLPKKDSHKGQNGQLLIIGGSKLFHAASLWAAEVSSYFVDMVHYFSTKENQKIFLKLKTVFRNGIVVSTKFLDQYLKEDDVVLVGPGMVRKDKLKIKSLRFNVKSSQDLFKIDDEGDYTYYLTKYLIDNYPEKKFVFDAGALQMMERTWLLKLKSCAILTPHQREFEDLFGVKLSKKSLEEKVKIVKETAEKYRVVILLKAIVDIISDGKEVYVIDGGNPGLTKGGSGDVLAGLVSSFYTKNDSFQSAIFASIILKYSADRLYERFKYWYNINKLIEEIPLSLNQLL